MSCFFNKRILFLLMGFSPLSMASYNDHSDRFALGIAAEAPGFEFKVRPEQESQTELNYQPNLRTTLGFAGSAYGFSASYLFQADQTRNEEVKKGKTSYDDIRLSKFFGSRKQWRLGAYYTRYSGFFIENSRYVDASLSDSDPYIQRPDLKFRNGGLSLMHIVDSEAFSVAAATDFSHQQTASGGSWLIKMDLDHTTFEARSAIVPAAVQADYGPDGSLTRGDFDTLSLSGGYGHSFVYNSFFFTLIGQLGFGLQQRSYTLNGRDEDSIHNSRKLMVLGTLGYNGEDYYSTLMFSYDSLQFETGSLYLETALTSFRWNLGRRF